MPTSPGALVDILTAIWDTIRSDLPRLPAAHITVTPTAPPADHGPERWSILDGRLQGLVISRETLAEGSDSVVTMLRHEAAHVMCWLDDVRDTARQGAYHNRSFLDSAVRAGLVWPEGEGAGARGFADPRLSAATRDRHPGTLLELDQVIPAVLTDLQPARQGPKRAQRPSFQCGCNPPRRIWAAQSTADAGEIVCGICGKTFT